MSDAPRKNPLRLRSAEDVRDAHAFAHDASTPGTPTDTPSVDSNRAFRRMLSKRHSVGEALGREQRFIVDVDATMRHILRHEDTLGHEKVTVEDRGPKYMQLPSYGSAGFRLQGIRGNYMVSSLLQQIALVDRDRASTQTRIAAAAGASPRSSDEVRRDAEAALSAATRLRVLVTDRDLLENAVDRLLRAIHERFTPALLRRVDAAGVAALAHDPKMMRMQPTTPGTSALRVYVPSTDALGRAYWEDFAKGMLPGLQVSLLPPFAQITPDYVHSLSDRPGILALALEPGPAAGSLRGAPFLVPGGRFNEMYGWDSYFAILGLLSDLSAEDDASLCTLHTEMPDAQKQVATHHRADTMSALHPNANGIGASLSIRQARHNILSSSKDCGNTDSFNSVESTKFESLPYVAGQDGRSSQHNFSAQSAGSLENHVKNLHPITEAHPLDSLAVAKGIVDNLVYQVTHYGRVLNANRTYYLLRSQPPFLTDAALQVATAAATRRARPDYISGTLPIERRATAAAIDDAWLEGVFIGAIAEYRGVWMAPPRIRCVDKTTLLAVDCAQSKGAASGSCTHHRVSCYGGPGRGIPPETETSHFDSVVRPHAEASGMHLDVFVAAYNAGALQCAPLDEYFRHDRAVRESGHDTTYRLDGRAADLATIDLCSLLYKYEADIAAYLASREASDRPLTVPGAQAPESSAAWHAAADARRACADVLHWCDAAGMYFDWDVASGTRSTYESATTLYSLWAGMASPAQAVRMVTGVSPVEAVAPDGDHLKRLSISAGNPQPCQDACTKQNAYSVLERFEVAGGLVSGTQASAAAAGPSSLDRPNRQWDWPCGWAPHQILAWTGLARYGWEAQARRLAYRWAYMVSRAAADFHGVVPEKFDVVRMSHKVTAEYGNVGCDFRHVAREGFGWMNASFVIAQHHLGVLERRALRALVPPESLPMAKSRP